MKTFKKIMRWIRGGYEYGDIGEFSEQHFYRRNIQTKEVEEKTESGWILIHPNQWNKFQIHDMRANEIKMQDGTFFQYTDAQRDSWGEHKFNAILLNHRRLAAERKLFKRQIIRK